MKNKIYSFIALIFIMLFSSKCTVHVKTLDQKIINKCKVCETLLNKRKFFEVPITEYDKAIHSGYFEPFNNELADSLKQRPKAAYYLHESHASFIGDHTYCLNGMTKRNVEKRLPEYLDVSSAPYDSETNQWYTRYSYNIGVYGKDSLITVYFSSSLALVYDIIGKDTIYQAGVDDLVLLKKCFDAEGVKYKD